MTFSEAEHNSNLTVSTDPGGPWTLTSALGVLSSLPVWLLPIADEECRTVPGVSVWNASLLPLAPDQYESGFLPFWSLIYENDSHDLLAAVSLNTSTHIVGPISPTTPCGSIMSQFVTGSSADPQLDSPAAAEYAWQIDGSTYIPTHANAFEFMETGFGQLLDYGSTAGGWIVGYKLCGLPAYEGSTAQFTTSVKFQNETSGYFQTTETGVCFPGDFEVSYGTAANESGPGGSVLTDLPISLGFANSTNLTDGVGLTTGSTLVSLVNLSSGQQGVPGVLDCTPGNLSATSCGPPESWYGALVTPTGYWIDAFGNFDGTVRWALPNVPFYTGDSLAIIHPFLGSDRARVSIVSNSSTVQVSGSAVI
jgi:hypothetical protein